MLNSEQNVQPTSESGNSTKPNVKCWCFLCHIELIEEKDKLEMYGETVCSQCWDDNMYMALQDGGGV